MATDTKRPPMPALVATDLYRFYHAGDDETLALRGVSLRVEAGETVAVIGPSGSGKSTLLACLAGLDEPDGGMVHVGGVPMSRQSEAERARVRARSVGVLFQSANLVEHLTVRANLVAAQQLARRVQRVGIVEFLACEDQVRLNWPRALSPASTIRACRTRLSHPRRSRSHA